VFRVEFEGMIAEVMDLVVQFAAGDRQEDRPVVIVFARTLGEPLGKLVHELDRQLKKHAPSELRGWVTVLASDAIVTEPKVIAWSQKHATGGVPIAVFEDMVGPPAYRIARDADVTVLLSVKQKTVANYAFRAGELNDAFVERISRNVSGMVESKK